MFLDLTKFNQPQVTQIGEMTIHTKGGVVHRDDGPAVYTPWSQEWYKNGVCHRDDGPARMFIKHPQPIGQDAIDAEGKFIAEWHQDGKFFTSAPLPEDVFHTHWHKGS